MLEKWRGKEEVEKYVGKKGDFGSRTELHRVVDAPRRGPAAGIASRRDRWGKEGTGEYIYYKLLLLFANSSFGPSCLRRSGNYISGFQL